MVIIFSLLDNTKLLLWTKWMSKKPKHIIAPNKLLHYTPFYEWDAKTATIKLNEVYEATLALADQTISWYQSYRKRKGYWSKRIRIIAILLLIGSTLMPYFASIKEDDTTTILYIGYLLAGLGGGLLLLDRYYGYSNSWMRFVLTGLDLEDLRNSFVKHFQIVIIKNQPLTPNSFCFLVEEMILFHETFNNAVKAETEKWAQEFQQNFKDLISALKAQSDGMKTAFEESKQQSQQNRTAGTTTSDGSIPSSVFQEAIAQKFNEWAQLYRVVAVAYGQKVRDGELLAINCLVFLPAFKLSEGEADFIPIPPTIPYKSSSGILYELPTDVRATGGPMRAASQPALLCDRNIPKRPGCSISRTDDHSKERTGTLGLKVYRNKTPFLLSCYHVLCSFELEQGQYLFSSDTAIGSPAIVSPSRRDSDQGMELGSVIEGELNQYLDGALMTINDSITIRDKVCSIDRKPDIELTVTESHARSSHAVVAVGRTTGIINGAILFHDTTCTVDYLVNGRWQPHKLEHIIITNQRAQAGDSGSVVLDFNNRVIGILAATTGEKSCIIPIERFLTRFTITLKPTI